MNLVVLTGRLTKEVELKQTNTGKTYTRFSLAVNKTFKKDECDFISCVAWEKTAELMVKYLGKGSKVGITGEINTGSYEKEGVKVFTTDVIVRNLEFLDSKKSGGSQSDDTNSDYPF